MKLCRRSVVLSLFRRQSQSFGRLQLASRGPTGKSVVAAGVLMAVVAAAAGGLARVRTDTGPESFLSAGDETLQSLRTAASSFGGDAVVVVLLQSLQPRELFRPQNLPRLLRLEGQLARLPNVVAVYGPATILNQIARSAQKPASDAVRVRRCGQARGREAEQSLAPASGNRGMTGRGRPGCSRSQTSTGGTGVE